MKAGVAALLAMLTMPAGAQVLTEWVESNPANAADKLELGYPVPIPVDTPLPFDGFRTYAGLHARHQDLAATTPWVHPEDIGSTRHGRTIWAYRLGDGDFEDIYGLPEGATLTNGGIHAREWQSPETVTGILELMATHPDDHHFYDYLRDNVNMIVIPSLNIDGFLQTQRFPHLSYLQTDINFPDSSPRDGRMRRKNMLGVDEVMDTVDDHLLGVDLNRNNPPFWNTNPNNSSPDNRSIVHFGAAPHSEPETQALDAAAQLGPISQLRLYTDVHSFLQAHLWVANGNPRLAAITEDLLRTFSNHHVTFPAGKNYLFNFAANVPTNVGIGSTDDFFTQTYQVPSWTLEIEPSQGAPNHPNLPGGGADYGGSRANGHDGFILPESQIRRVREELAQSFAAVYYKQAGPPSVRSVQFIDKVTNALVYEAVWDVVDSMNRELHVQQLQPLEIGRQYIQWVSFTKPMRWRVNGQVVPFPGIDPGFLNILGGASVGGQDLTRNVLNTSWLNEPGGSPGGYLNYEDDAYAIDFSWALDTNNAGLVGAMTAATINILTWDMTAALVDANPATVTYWEDGNWNQYENTQGVEGDQGGEDSSLSIQLTNQQLPPPFLLEPGTAAAWGDTSRNGEGFILEMLDNNVAVMFWFTYDDAGEQDWYIGVGEVRGNRIVFPRVLRVSGGVFGDDFDPALVSEEVVGSARFLWTGCASGTMDWHIGNRTGRQELARLTTILGLECGSGSTAPPPEQAAFSGSWGDPAHDGEGFTVEVLADGTALVFWFSFGPDGKRRWYFGIGRPESGKYVFDNMLTTTGGLFGKDFDPADVSEVHWGSLELELDCAGGTAVYLPVETGFEPGQQAIGKITEMSGVGCTP